MWTLWAIQRNLGTVSNSLWKDYAVYECTETYARVVYFEMVKVDRNQGMNHQFRLVKRVESVEEATA